MADNITNSKNMFDKKLDAFSESGMPKELDKGLSQRFSGLVSGEAEGVLLAQEENISLNSPTWDLSNNQSSGNGVVLGEHIDSLPSRGTLGDKILNAMQSIRENVEDGAKQVAANLDPARETMSMREMFETQWAMSNLMITEDYIGKVVGKATQAFDTLLRNQ